MSSVVTWHPGVILPAEKLTPEIIASIKSSLFPAQVVGLTAWAEARSRYVPGLGWRPNPIDAMADICNVIHNRATDPRWAAKGYSGVCFQRWAFSCWEPTGGPDDPHDADKLAENFEALLERAQYLLAGKDPSPKLTSCIEVAESFLNGRHDNLLGEGVCHYLADWIDPWPTWAQGQTPVLQRHGHLFFAGIR